MLKPIMYRGSSGTIGDMFFTSHYMYHQSLRRKVIVVLPAELNPYILSLYSPEHQPWIDHIVFMPAHDFQDDRKYLKLCEDNDCESNRYMLDLGILKDVTFHPLSEWFHYSDEPTFDSKGYIGLQIMSSGNWVRPRIPHIDTYIGLIKGAGYRIALMGGAGDKDNFMKEYPQAGEWVKGDIYAWRFGRDSVLQTMANIKGMVGVLAFSSWTAYVAVLQGVPAMELWARDQWQFFSVLAYRMLGSPIHYLQDAFDTAPTPYLMSDIIPALKRYRKAIYD
jgi:hypothetical protein